MEKMHLLKLIGNKSNRRSPAWDHFKKLPGETKNQGKAKCIHHDSLFSSMPISGTSHLKRYVERCAKRLAINVQPIPMDTVFVEFEGNDSSIKLEKETQRFGMNMSCFWLLI